MVSDDLCQPQTLRNLRQQLDTKLLVLGACPKLKQVPYLWEEADDAASRSYSVAIVDLLAEASALFNDDAAIERAKLLLWSQVKRADAFEGIRQDNLKVRLSIPRYKVSRRQFLAAALPRYEIVPCVDQSRCRGADKCGLCQSSCTANAVTIEQNMVVINRDRCSGCGACMASCPYNAVYYPTFSLEELDNAMEGLLSDQSAALESRIIAFACETCLSALDGDNNGVVTYPANVLPLEIPCLAMASPWLMLRAFDMGCQALVLISGQGGCHRGVDHNAWEKNIEFVKALLDSWDISSERVRLFRVSEDNVGEVAEGLTRFADEIALLGTTQFRLGEPSEASEGVLRLPELIRRMGSRSGSSFSGAISAGAVPFGKLSLDSSECTGCGLCAASCPTDALTVGTGKDGAHYQLLFRQDACVGCSKCVDVCPEKCLKLQRVLELDRIYASASELFRDDMLNCRRCGEPVAPMSMIMHLKDKLQNPGDMLLEQLELCGRCKAETQRYKVAGKKVSPLADVGMAYFTHDQAGQERSE